MTPPIASHGSGSESASRSRREHTGTDRLHAEHAAVEWSPDSGWLRLTVEGCRSDPLDWIRSHVSVSTDVVVDLRDRRLLDESGIGAWARGSYYLG